LSFSKVFIELVKRIKNNVAAVTQKFFKFLFKINR